MGDQAVDAFFTVFARQRACRSYTSDPVDDELIERLLWVASRAPSAENRQPWTFIVVRDQDRRLRLGELARRAWEGGGRAYASHHLEADLLRDVERGATGGLAVAPVMLVACIDTDRCHPNALGPSIFPAIQNLLLAATALGLGSVLTTLSLAFHDEVVAMIEVPANIQPVAVVPIGWPARTLGSARRNPPATFTYRETYQHPW